MCYRSFSPTSDQVEQMARCKEICQTLAGDMQKENIKVSQFYSLEEFVHTDCLQGRTVTLKMKTADFEVKSRGLTLPRSISKSGEILRVASDLLRQEIEVFGQIPLKLRLLGKYKHDKVGLINQMIFLLQVSECHPF